MRPRQRFTSHKAIITAIDDEQHNLENDLKLVEQYDAEIAALKQWFAKNPHDSKFTEIQLDIWHGKFGRLKLCKTEVAIRRRAYGRHQCNLNKLKAALAEFDTQPMSFLTDGSVVRK